MLSAFKKVFAKDEDGVSEGGKKLETPRALANASSPGIQQMDASLQRRFARGVHYNMKIIIRGDRNTGKSCLFQRLKGQNFSEEYIATDEIQVGSINWSYKTTDDVVKVEVWDVVDRGKRKKKGTGLKIANAPSLPDDAEDPVLDAEWLDVYKGTHGVVMVTDMTKTWTLEYVKKELPRIPPKIPVLILANFRDLGNSRAIPKAEYECAAEEATLQRGPDGAEVRYAECSMKTAFGLKFLHRFFNVPFLYLQRETLTRQLETNERELGITRRELNALMDSEEQNYDVFCQNLVQRRGSESATPSKSPTTPTRGGFPADGLNPGSPTPNLPTTKAAPTSKNHSPSLEMTFNAVNGPKTAHVELPASVSRTSSKPSTPKGIAKNAALPTSMSQTTRPTSLPSTSASPKATTPAASAASRSSRHSSTTSTPSPNVERSFHEDNVSGSGRPEARVRATPPPSPLKPSATPNGLPFEATEASAKGSAMKSVDEFVIEDGLETDFLADVVDANKTSIPAKDDASSDSDSDANPMVAAFEEDVQPEVFTVVKPPVVLDRIPTPADDDDDDEDVERGKNTPLRRISTQMVACRLDDKVQEEKCQTPAESSASVLRDQPVSDVPTTRKATPASIATSSEMTTAVSATATVSTTTLTALGDTDDALENWLEEETPSGVVSAPTLKSSSKSMEPSEESEPSTPDLDRKRTTTPPLSSQTGLEAKAAAAPPATEPPPLIASLTLDDFRFLEAQSGVSEVAANRKVNVASTAMLTPSSSLCDISESSDRSAEPKKKSKKKKKENEDDTEAQKTHKKKKKPKDKEEDVAGGVKKKKATKKTGKKSKEDQQAMEFLGTHVGVAVGGEYESL